MHRYHVKFKTAKGETIYGIYQDYLRPEEKAGLKAGCCLVADAVLPEVYEVAESALIDIPMTLPTYGKNFELIDGSEYDRHVADEIKKAKELSDSLVDRQGVQVGAMFKLGVADGYAYYVVTKVNKKTCKVEWRGFGGDRYTDHHFEWGGTFPLKDVERYVKQERAMAKLFASRG